MGSDLKRYRRIKDVPRPSPGRAAFFIHVRDNGEEVLTTMSDDGRTHVVMSAADTKAQLEAMNKRR